MSDENEEVLKAKDDENDHFVEVPPVSSNVIEGDFTDIPLPRPAVEVADDDDGTIAAEVVEEPPPPLIGKLEEPGDEDPTAAELQKLIATIPKGTDVTIVVKRKADRGENFRIKFTGSFGHIDNVYWDRRPLEEVYAEVQRIHGGGRYHFQFQYNGGLQPGAWNFMVFDPPFPSEMEKMLAKQSEPERIPNVSQTQPAAPVVVPLDEEALLEKTFDKLERMQKFFDRFKPEAAAEPAAREQRSVKEEILVAMATNMATDPQMGASVLRKAFGLDTSEKRGMGDVFTHYAMNPGEVVTAFQAVSQILGLIGPMFGLGGAPKGGAGPAARTMITLPPAAPTQPGVTMPPGGPAAETAAEGQQAAPAAPMAPQPARKRVKW